MDSIEPLHHTPAQVSTKEGDLLPKNEYRHEHVIEMVAHIQKLCTYRAEETRVWADKVRMIMRDSRTPVDYGKTWDALKRICDRIIRGEFLVSCHLSVS